MVAVLVTWLMIGMIIAALNAYGLTVTFERKLSNSELFWTAAIVLIWPPTLIGAAITMYIVHRDDSSAEDVLENFWKPLSRRASVTWWLRRWRRHRLPVICTIECKHGEMPWRGTFVCTNCDGLYVPTKAVNAYPMTCVCGTFLADCEHVAPLCDLCTDEHPCA